MGASDSSDHSWRFVSFVPAAKCSGSKAPSYKRVSCAYTQLILKNQSLANMDIVISDPMTDCSWLPFRTTCEAEGESCLMSRIEIFSHSILTDLHKATNNSSLCRFWLTGRTMKILMQVLGLARLCQLYKALAQADDQWSCARIIIGAVALTVISYWDFQTSVSISNPSEFRRLMFLQRLIFNSLVIDLCRCTLQWSFCRFKCLASFKTVSCFQLLDFFWSFVSCSHKCYEELHKLWQDRLTERPFSEKDD